MSLPDSKVILYEVHCLSSAPALMILSANSLEATLLTWISITLRSRITWFTDATPVLPKPCSPQSVSGNVSTVAVPGVCTHSNTS